MPSQSKQRSAPNTTCLPCKSGKRKCDKTNPACRRCQSLGVTCQWPNNTSSKRGNESSKNERLQRRELVRKLNDSDPRLKEVSWDKDSENDMGDHRRNSTGSSEGIDSSDSGKGSKMTRLDSACAEDEAIVLVSNPKRTSSILPIGKIRLDQIGDTRGPADQFPVPNLMSDQSCSHGLHSSILSSPPHPSDVRTELQWYPSSPFASTSVNAVTPRTMSFLTSIINAEPDDQVARNTSMVIQSDTLNTSMSMTDWSEADVRQSSDFEAAKGLFLLRYQSWFLEGLDSATFDRYAESALWRDLALHVSSLSPRDQVISKLGSQRQVLSNSTEAQMTKLDDDVSTCYRNLRNSRNDSSWTSRDLLPLVRGGILLANLRCLQDRFVEAASLARDLLSIAQQLGWNRWVRPGDRSNIEHGDQYPSNLFSFSTKRPHTKFDPTVDVDISLQVVYGWWNLVNVSLKTTSMIGNQESVVAFDTVNTPWPYSPSVLLEILRNSMQLDLDEFSPSLKREEDQIGDLIQSPVHVYLLQAWHLLSDIVELAEGGRRISESNDKTLPYLMSYGEDRWADLIQRLDGIRTAAFSEPWWDMPIDLDRLQQIELRIMMSVGVILLRASRSETEADSEVIEAIAEVDLAISFPVFEPEMLDRIDWFVIASLQKIQIACTEEFARVKRSSKGSWTSQSAMLLRTAKRVENLTKRAGEIRAIEGMGA